MKSVLKHVLIVVIALIITLGVPSAIFFDIFSDKTVADAKTGATFDLPDKPSGDFVVLINEKRHDGSLYDWVDFFCERDYDVLMDDISCLVVSGDAHGRELADRYMARLAVNQMKITEENVMLVITKAEYALIDVVIMSKEVADAYDLTKRIEGVMIIEITSSEDQP